jgi:hypothetical protein
MDLKIEICPFNSWSYELRHKFQPYAFSLKYAIKLSDSKSEMYE